MKTVLISLTLFLCSQFLFAQVSKTVYLANAGTLSAELTTEELNTITDLTITGDIDARDFKTMRDDMPVLANIDLGEASILEYNGTGGTDGNSTYMTFNKANTIPNRSFSANPPYSYSAKLTLISINLPSTVTSVGNEAFSNCFNLVYVNFPLSLNKIGNYSFMACTSIDNIQLPSSIQIVGTNAFTHVNAQINVDENNQAYSSFEGVLYNKSMTELIQCPVSKTGIFNIPEGVTKVGTRAFYYCKSLTEITIPNTVIELANGDVWNCGAFYACHGITTIKIPANTYIIGRETFADCININKIYTYTYTPVDVSLSPEVFTGINKQNTILYVPSGSRASYQAADQWEDFQNIVEMEPTIEMPLNVTAGGLASLLPQSVRDTLTYLSLTGTIDARDFKTMRDSLPLLANLDLSGVSIVEYIGTEGTIGNSLNEYSENAIPDWAFCYQPYGNGKESLSIVKLPKSATSIKSGAFLNCQNLKHIDFNDSISVIEYAAFSNCVKISNLFLPASLLEIGPWVFAGCTGLIESNLPENLTNIGEFAFGSCTNLSSITIPVSLNSFQQGAFRGFSGDIYVDENNQSFCSIDGVLYNKNKNLIIQCPTSKSGHFIIPGTVQSIGNMAFESCDKLTQITIPSSVNSIGFDSFFRCYSLSSISFPNSVRNISQWAFRECTALDTIYVYLSNPVDISLGSDVFNGIVKDNCTLFIPNGSKAAFQSADQWKDFQNIVEMPQVDLDSGLVAYYPFNGNANDESGNGFNGILEGQVSFENGAIGDAARFNGNSVGDYIIAEQSYPDSMSQITISAWVKVTDFDMNCWSGSEAILSCGHPYSDNFFELSVSRNEEPSCGSATSLDSIGFRLYITHHVFFETKKEYSPDNWYHVVGLYDGKSVKIIVNDSVAVNREIVYNRKLFAESRFLINKQDYYSNGRMGGLIDELRLYNRALNAIEIDSLYREGENVTESNIELRKGLLAYYPFNGNTLDESGNRNDGEMRGTPEYVPGSLGNCIRLEGTTNNAGMTDEGDHIVLPPFDFITSKQFSFSIWVKEESMTWWHGTGYLFLGDGYGGNAAIAHYGDDTNGQYVGFSSGATNASPDNDPSHPEFYLTTPFDGDNKWVHYALSFKNDTIYAYRDGVLVGTKYQTLKISGNNAGIACHWWDNGTAISTRFTGLIDEVRIYDRALNEVEIDSLFMQGATVNHTPVANAGSDQIVDEGITVILDGSASFDADGDTLIYTWNAISKNVNLTSTNTAQTSFIAPDVESGAGYLVSLTVSDGFLTSNPDTIMILVYNVESKANVDIYKTTVTPIIDGFEDDIWNIVAAVPIAKNFGSESPTVEAYWKAMWTDSGLYVLINVNDDNHWPSWESGGSQWEYDWSEIFLDVNDTLVDGLGFGNYNSGHYAVNVDYEENQYGSLIEYFGFTSYRLTGENLVREQFIPFSLMSDKNGTIIDKNRILELKEIGFDITIDDQDEGITTSRHRKVWQSSAIDNDCYYSMDGAGTITFKEENLNQSPIANAGPDQVVEEGAAVTLDGTLSYDIEGDSLIYVWTAPFGIDLSDASSPKPSFTAPEVITNTTYIFTLTVNDGNSTSVPDSVSIIVFTEPCPQHYHTVWEGTLGFDHMNINVIGARYDGMDLESGDEIGIFDGDICVGYGKVTGTIGLQNILSIKVSRDDGTGNGFTSGNEVIYKIWNCSDSAEYAVQEVTCYDIELNPITCSPFEAGGTSFVELSGKGEECFTLEFRTGWNLFSVPVVMDSTNMKYVFQPMIDSKSLVKIQDEMGNSLENWGIFGGWQNYIGAIGLTEGYKIKVNWLDSIHVCGQRVKYPYAIVLQTGWNIIGYPQSGMYDAQEVVQQLIDRNTLLKVQDEMGNSLENWGIFGGWQNNIGNLLPGEGYKVKVSAQDTLWIYENYTKSGTIQPELLAATHFRQNYAGNGVDHMNINLVGLPINVLQTGDELAVFEGEACVGAVKLTQHNINNQAVQLTASAFDGQVAGGFTEGRQFTLKLWSLATGAEYTITPEILSGSATFAKHETTVASLEKYTITGFDEMAGVGAAAVRCYPNPFSESVTIEINLSAEAEVEVEVLNQLGQVVSQLIPNQRRAAGIHQLVWNGRNPQGQQVTPGIYHLRVRMNESVLHRKVIFSK